MKKPLIVLAGLALALTASAFIVRAQTGTNPLSGWGWSSNIGWISFNSSDAGSGGGPYNVYVDALGNFGGYAWSPNIGWISFNQSDLSASPACPGATAASVNTSDGSVSGWARAIVGENPATTGSYGWDGCIELSDNSSQPSNHPTGFPDGSKGVTYVPSSHSFVGYAWGGPVVGWLQFDPSIGHGVDCPGCGGGSSFAVTGNTVSIDPSSSPISTSIQVSEGTGDTSSQTINLSLGSYTSSDITIAYTGATSCALSSSNLSCTIPVSITLNTNTPASSYSIPVIGTRSSDNTTQQATLLVNASGPTQSNCTPGQQICLSIGTLGSSINRSSISVIQGNPFSLAWTNSLDYATYSCSALVTKPDNTSGAGLWTSWDSSDVGQASGSVTSLSTSGSSIVTGMYSFKIQCSDKTTQAKILSNLVTLQVKSSSIQEF